MSHHEAGPDYVTLVIEWDALEGGTPTASETGMPTKSPDWMIDTAGKDSFPASDPPAFGSGRAAASQASIDSIDGIESADPAPVSFLRRYRTPIVLGVLGAVALTGIVIGVRFARRR